MLKYKVIISDLARDMLISNIRFLANENIPAANKIKNELMQAIRSLSDMPERFPFFNAEFIPANKYRKMFVESWYLILYQVRDSVVFVDYILDCRKDYKWLV